MRRFILTLMLVLVASLPTRAEGLGDLVYEVKGGLLYHDMDNLWSGFRRESGVDLNAELVFTPSLPVLGGAIRPALGGSLNSSGDTSKAYLDAVWSYETNIGLYFGLGLGAAVHNGDLELRSRDHKALGSRVLFHIPAEIGYRFDGHNGISLYFDHVSNGFLASPNEGMDTLGVRYGYKF
ncbi:Lipid A 3-O-deacylase-related protein [Rhodospirillaceae bacterium LM-1]|nr:Lipid A 3-O-deacylase-related protein [Rhodospirillaceae bacterium LM-1]